MLNCNVVKKVYKYAVIKPNGEQIEETVLAESKEAARLRLYGRLKEINSGMRLGRFLGEAGQEDMWKEDKTE